MPLIRRRGIIFIITAFMQVPRKWFTFPNLLNTIFITAPNSYHWWSDPFLWFIFWTNSRIIYYYWIHFSRTNSFWCQIQIKNRYISAENDIFIYHYNFYINTYSWLTFLVYELINTIFLRDPNRFFSSRFRQWSAWSKTIRYVNFH